MKIRVYDYRYKGELHIREQDMTLEELFMFPHATVKYTPIKLLLLTKLPEIRVYPNE